MKAASFQTGILCRVEFGYESRTETLSLHSPIRVVTLTGSAAEGAAAAAVDELPYQGLVTRVQEDINNPRPGKWFIIPPYAINLKIESYI